MAFNHFLPHLCAALVLINVTGAARAQCVPGTPTKGVVAPVPYGFKLGKTTLAEAEAKWQEEASSVLGRGNAAIGAGSGQDGESSVAAEKIMLIDLADVPLEGPRKVRFVFFDGVLYSVQAQLRAIIDPNAPKATDKEIEEFAKQVRQRYGAPSQACRSIFAGKKPDVLIWKYGSDTLTISTVSIRSEILYSNTALAKQANTYKDKLCRSTPSCN